MSTVPAGISWVLVPVTVPEARALHYRATATCVHGTTEHYIVVPSQALVRDSLAGLTPSHTLTTSCSCSSRELLIKEG